MMNEYQELCKLLEGKIGRPQTKKFSPGDIVRCIVPRSRVASKWDLEAGFTYDVADYHEGGIRFQFPWGPRAFCVRFYDANRFVLVSRAAQPARLQSEQMIISRERVAA